MFTHFHDWIWMFLIKFISQTQLNDRIDRLNTHCLDWKSQSVIEFTSEIIILNLFSFCVLRTFICEVNVCDNLKWQSVSKCVTGCDVIK